MPQSKRFLLRLDPRLFDALRRWAHDDLRSINAQIEYLLTEQARRAGRLTHRTSRRSPPDAAADDGAGSDLGGDPDLPTAAARDDTGGRPG